jgi:hypothetical protein
MEKIILMKKKCDSCTLNDCEKVFLMTNYRSTLIIIKKLSVYIMTKLLKLHQKSF